MTLRVRLFAGLREAMGWSERLIDQTPNATPLSLWRELHLEAAQPSLTTHRQPTGGGGEDGLPGGIRVAINQQFANVHTPLADGDEVAFLPPISGG